jgi:putative methanogenesis marker domain 9
MPVKECPLIPMLSRTGISHDDFVKMKLGGVSGTPLDTGRQTCFGSLAWCCKTSSPCMFRDMTLKQAGIPKKEYMRLKRELSDTIMAQVFHDVPPVKYS